jgi:hypothetical protein
MSMVRPRKVTHAYYLARDLDNDGRIDHMDVRLPVGAHPHALNALLSTDYLYSEQLGRHAVTSLGTAPVGGTRWRSITPFVAPAPGPSRAPRSGILRAWIADEVRVELRNHGIADRCEVIVWEERPPMITHDGGRRSRFDAFIQGHRGLPEHRPVLESMSYSKVRYLDRLQLVVKLTLASASLPSTVDKRSLLSSKA